MSQRPTTPQPGSLGRRGSRPLQQAMTFSAPSPPQRHSSLRKKSKTFDTMGSHEDDDEGGASKGGHSLRKRARVNYKVEQIDDEVVVPNSTLGTRATKKRWDLSPFEAGSQSVPRGNKKAKIDGGPFESAYASTSKRRRASFGPDTPSNRRRATPPRGSSEVISYGNEEDDDPAFDTIEVGVTQSDYGDSDEESDRESTASPKVISSSEPVSQELRMPQDSKVEATSPRPGIIRLRLNRAKPSPEPASVQPISKSTPVAMAVSPAETSAPTTTEAPPVPTAAALTNAAGTPNATMADHQPDAMPTSVPDSTSVALANQVPSPDEAAEQLLNEATKTPVLPSETLAKPEVIEPREAEEASRVAASHDSSERAEPEQFRVNVPALEQAPPNAQPEEPAISKPNSVPRVTVEPPPPRKASSPPVIEAAPGILHPSTTQDESPAEEALTTNGVVKDTMTVDRDTDIVKEVTHESVSKPASPVAGPQDVASQAKSPEMKPTEPQEAVITPLNLSAAATPTKSGDPVRTAVRNIMQASIPQRPKIFKPSKPQPTPAGRWAHLTPYVDDAYVSYPEKAEKKPSPEEENDDKASEKDSQEAEPSVEDNEDAPDASVGDVATPALNTPTRGSPAPDLIDATAVNSPMPAAEEPEEIDGSETQETTEAKRHYRYRKLRDADDFIDAIGNYENMSTDELYEMLEAVNVSLVQWETEYSQLGRTVDDYENAQRRRAADVKYEAKCRNANKHANPEEPDIQLKGYKARQQEIWTPREVQRSQDRLQAMVYGFEYDSHPTKVGNQDPETQQSGIRTRGRSLRNQPKQTAKATEADEVTGKRQRKAAQLFEPPAQEVSRPSTPVPGSGAGPGRGRRRKVNIEPEPVVAFNNDNLSEGEAPVRRRKRGPQPKQRIENGHAEVALVTNAPEPVKTGRRGRGKQQPQADPYEGSYPFHYIIEQPKPKSTHSWGLKVVLKVPNANNALLINNGDSRPSSPAADSEHSSHTAESSYSFRPKRQKRFRDEPDDLDDFGGRPRKRGKHASNANQEAMTNYFADEIVGTTRNNEPISPLGPGNFFNERKPGMKIKLVRTAPEPDRATASTPGSIPEEGDRKDYKAMTKSEKMSASMKSRWANGNMAGAVEKRKATLAAKKAAQAAAEQKLGPIAPKPKSAKAGKKESPSESQTPPVQTPMNMESMQSQPMQSQPMQTPTMPPMQGMQMHAPQPQPQPMQHIPPPQPKHAPTYPSAWGYFPPI